MPPTFVKHKISKTWFQGPGRAWLARGAVRGPEAGAPASRGRRAPPPEARPAPAAPALAVVSRGVRGGPLAPRRSEELEGKFCPARGALRPGVGWGGVRGGRRFRLGGGPGLGLPAPAAAGAAWAGGGGCGGAPALPAFLSTAACPGLGPASGNREPPGQASAPAQRSPRAWLPPAAASASASASVCGRNSPHAPPGPRLPAVFTDALSRLKPGVRSSLTSQAWQPVP